MPIGGYYGAGNADNVTDDGSLNGWAAQSGQYGAQIGGRSAYCFGPIVNNYGTWGQFIYDAPANRGAPDYANPSGLNGVMPGGVPPGGSWWVQGHLVNGECGGRGNIAENLAPFSHNLNMSHKGFEAVVLRLANAGGMANALTIMFNPNGFPNSRLIYRTHCVAGPAGPWPGPGPHPFPTVPTGIVVSLGIVINGLMRSALQVQAQFNANPLAANRWFGAYYYGAQGASDRVKIIQMIGGHQIDY